MRFTLRSTLPMLRKPGITEEPAPPGQVPSFSIQVPFILSHPIPADKMGALTYLIFFIRTQLSQDPDYLQLVRDWHDFFDTPNPEALISKADSRIAQIFRSMMSKSDQFQHFCELTRDPLLKQPANLRQAIHVICHRTIPFHIRAERTQSAAIVCAFLNQIYQLYDLLTNVLYGGQTISTFGRDLPPEFAFVQIQKTHIDFIIQQLFSFIEGVYEAGRLWGSYGRYVQKTHPPLLPQGGRSFLLFTKQENPNRFYIILKSNTKISSGEQETFLHESGTTKQNKLYNLLITLQYDPVTQILVPHPGPKRIITFAEPTHTFLIAPPAILPAGASPGSVLPPPPVRTPPPTKEERLTQKTTSMEHTIQHLPHEFVTWDGILTFTSPDLPHVRRMLGYQTSAGKNLTIATLLTWSPTQRKHAIVSLLSDWKQICEKHILPSDIKIWNMCFEFFPTSPDEIELKFVDYISFATTFSFLNHARRPQPYKHPNPYLTAQGRNAHNLLRTGKNMFNRRELISPQNFQLVLYHMFYEVIFAIFFIWNPDLFLTTEQDIRFDEWLGQHRVRFPTRDAAQTALDARGPRPFTDTLMHFTYDQEFLPEIAFQELHGVLRAMVRDFFTQLRHDMMTLPGVAHHPNDEIALPEVPVPQTVRPIINPNGRENDVLSDAWINSFADVIATIRDTPSPFLQPLQITRLTMI